MTTPVSRFHVGPRLSEMAVSGGVAYLAGQVADDASADIRGQTQQVLAAVDRLLVEAICERVGRRRQGRGAIRGDFD